MRETNERLDIWKENDGFKQTKDLINEKKMDVEWLMDFNMKIIGEANERFDL